MTSKEIRKMIEDKKAEMRSLVESEDFTTEKADSLKEEVRKLESKLSIVEEAEKEEKRSLENKVEGKGEVRMENKKMSKEMRSLLQAKTVLGYELTAEERSLVEADGNWNSNSTQVLPEEFIAKVVQLQDGYTSLKSYCAVTPVHAYKGSMPVVDLNGKLVKLSEATDIKEQVTNLDEIDYSVEDYGLILPVSQDTLDDAGINFISEVILPQFAIKSLNSENEEIMKVVAGHCTTATVGDTEEVADVLAKKITTSFKPSYRKNLIIITNGEGWAYIDNLKTADGKKDDRVTYVGDKMFFKGKEVVEVDEDNLPSIGGGKSMVFYLSNLKSVNFFDRKQIEIAESKDVYFKQNKKGFRAIERFDVQNNPSNKLKSVKIEK